LQLKDKGYHNIKLNQTVDLIPKKLKAQAEIFLESKKTNKFSLELVYSMGVRSWINWVLMEQPSSPPLSSSINNIQQTVLP
jgi:hypothetical protein